MDERRAAEPPPKRARTAETADGAEGSTRRQEDASLTFPRSCSVSGTSLLIADGRCPENHEEKCNCSDAGMGGLAWGVGADEKMTEELRAKTAVAVAGEVGRERIGAHGMIRRTEFVRLLEQSLYSLGYGSAARLLEMESGIALQSKTVAEFGATVLSGQWEQSLQLVESMGVRGKDAKRAKFLIRRQHFLELLEAGKAHDAVVILRSHLARHSTNQKQPRQLAALLMCPDAAELRARADWQGVGGDSRLKLLESLRLLLPPDAIIPERRLENLVEQALMVQRADCEFHNLPEPTFSLLFDHSCSRDVIPSVTTQILEGHTDEVWYLQFSHSGSLLASASKDRSAIIWEISDPRTHRMRHRLEGHSEALSFVAWSPDDSLLLTCAGDRLVLLWDVASGKCLRSFRGHTDEVTSCAWFPCGRRFASGGLDKSLIIWRTEEDVAAAEGGEEETGEDAAEKRDGTGMEHDGEPGGARADVNGTEEGKQQEDGEGMGEEDARRERERGEGDNRGEGSVSSLEVQRWSGDGWRIKDIAISPDGNYMVMICDEKKIRIHRFCDGTDHAVVESMSITSLCMSRDAKWLLLNLASGVLHLWAVDDIINGSSHTSTPDEVSPPKPTSKFSGQVQGSFVIRSCFGGSDQDFIVSGSEDSQVYIWHRETKEILSVLPGHSMTVNAVSWSTSNPVIFASASDDGTIRIWGQRKAGRGGEGVKGGGGKGARLKRKDEGAARKEGHGEEGAGSGDRGVWDDRERGMRFRFRNPIYQEDGEDGTVARLGVMSIGNGRL